MYVLNFHLVWNTSRYERLYVCLFVFIVLFCSSFGSRSKGPCALKFLIKMLIRLYLMWEGLVLLYRNFVCTVPVSSASLPPLVSFAHLYAGAECTHTWHSTLEASLTVCCQHPVNRVHVQFIYIIKSKEYSGVQWSTVEYSGVQWSTVEYIRVQWSTVEYSEEQWSTVEYNRVLFFLLEIGHLQKLIKQGRRKQTENRTLLGNCYCVISITGMEWRQRVRKVQTFWIWLRALRI